MGKSIFGKSDARNGIYSVEEDPDSEDEVQPENEEHYEEFVAPERGRSSESKPPRFEVEKLRPFEVMFADEKSYSEPQRSGWTTSLMVLDLASDAWFKVDETSKTQHGKSFRDLMIKNGVHLLDYPRVVYTDGCGSMNILRDAAIKIGINHIFIPPHEQSLNEAERIADRAFAAARINMAATGALPTQFAMALDHVCYMKTRMATTASRNFLTPYEIIKGQTPNIMHCKPFFTKAYVTVPKDKRSTMIKKGLAHVRAESGRLVGYHDMWSTTAKVLLDGNRLVHSRNVSYDITDFGLKSTKAKPKPKSSKTLDSFEDFLTDHITGKTNAQDEENPLQYDNPLNQEGDSPYGSPGYSPWSSPADSGNESCEVRIEDFPLMPEDMESCEVDIESLPRTPQYGRGHREGRNTQNYQPHTAYTDVGGAPDYNPRSIFLATMEKLIRLDNKVDVFNAQLNKASKTLNEASTVPDVQGHLICGAELANHAQKDMNWKKALDSDHRDAALKALEDELTSLKEYILTELNESDPDWKLAVETATPGRLLLDIKRSGKYKVRGVEQGFRENLENTDGSDFNYYSNVVKFNAIRLALAKRRSQGEEMAIKDISVAFLQSDPYPDGKVKYISFKHPVTYKWLYYRQTGPIYGEASAPVRWENTVAPWIEEQGFIRGENERCVFHHPERDVLLLLYVDDIMVSGDPADVEWIFGLLEERFKCKDADKIEPGIINDYLGMQILAEDDMIYMSMQSYIENACDVLNITSKERSTPISEPVDTNSELLDSAGKKQFLTAVGMLGWLANTTRLDVSYAYSRVAQHSANPTKSALDTVYRIFQYLESSKTYCLASNLYGKDIDVNNAASNVNNNEQDLWRFFTDSDHAGNAEIQNRRRSQNGLVVTYNGCPILWQSKASSVTFANKDIGEAHADMSSGAVEIYAAGNATMDILGLSYVVEEMGMEFPRPFILEMDNEAARIFSNASAQKTKLKHIDCRQEWVRTLRNRNLLRPAHVPTEDNLADLMTKILDKKTFIGLRERCMQMKDFEDV